MNTHYFLGLGKRKHTLPCKKVKNNFVVTKNITTFAIAFEKITHKQIKSNDSLAQLVEHNTFNVGVMGSNPMRVTPKKTSNGELRNEVLRFLFEPAIMSLLAM